MDNVCMHKYVCMYGHNYYTSHFPMHSNEYYVLYTLVSAKCISILWI